MVIQKDYTPWTIIVTKFVTFLCSIWIEVLTCLVEVGSWRTGVVLIKLGVLWAVVTHRTDGGGDGSVHTVVTCHSQKSEVKS